MAIETQELDVEKPARRQASVFVVEPYEIIRSALVRTIEGSDDGIAAVGHTGDLAAGPDLAERLQPDIILVGTTDDTDYDIVRELRKRVPGSHVVVLSTRSDGDAVLEALRAGATGFIPKWAQPEEIIEGLSRIAHGQGLFVHPAVAAAALLTAVGRDYARKEHRDLLGSLTPREFEVLQRLSKGISPSRMSEDLFLSRRTVESHLAGAYRKLGVHTRVEATNEFRRLRRLETGDPDL